MKILTLFFYFILWKNFYEIVIPIHEGGIERSFYYIHSQFFSSFLYFISFYLVFLHELVLQFHQLYLF